MYKTENIRVGEVMILCHHEDIRNGIHEFWFMRQKDKAREVRHVISDGEMPGPSASQKFNWSSAICSMKQEASIFQKYFNER